MNYNSERINISKQAQSKYRKLSNLLSDENIDEKVFTSKYLDILIDLIEKVNILLSQTKLNKKDINNNKEKLINNTINRAIKKILAMNNIEVTNLWYSLFLPWKKTIDWDNNLNELKIVDKYSEVLRVIYELYFWEEGFNIKVSEEKLNEKQLRKVSYKIIHFSTYNKNKTILICNQIWQATYIYDWIIDVNIFQNIIKWLPINWIVPCKVIYLENYANMLSSVISEDNENIICKNNLSEKEIENYEGEYYNAQNIKNYIINYWWKTEKENYMYFMTLKRDKINEIKYKWNNVTKLSQISWWNNPNNLCLYSKRWFQEWISWLFWKNYKINQEIKKYFINYKWKNKEESFNYWMKLTSKEICEIEYYWNKIITISKMSWWKNPKNLNLQISYWFQEWIRWIYWKENDWINKEKVINYFKNYKWKNEAESYLYLMKLTLNDLKWIEYSWFKIMKLTKITWWKKERIRSPKQFQEWIRLIFWREDDKIDKEDIINYFRNYECREEKENFKYFMNLSSKEICNLEYKWKKVNSLITITWWKKPKPIKISSPKYFQKWVEWLFHK